MMRFASLCLFSALWVLFATDAPYESNPNQEALISCLKLRRQTPHLNLKCEDLLLHSGNKNEIGRPIIPLIYAKTQQKEPNEYISKENILELTVNDLNSTKNV